MNTGPPIDFVGLRVTNPHDRQQIIAAIDSALTAGPLLNGPAVTDLEHRCALALNRAHTVAVGSGTDALTLALRACGVGHDDEVIVTSFSFVASASPILHVGATPVFAPIDETNYHMRVDALPGLLSSSTKAIIAVHLFGQCLPEIAGIEDFAHHHGVYLIEDAAQAFGATIDGRPAGSFGHASTLSFDPSKVLGGITTGGLIATDEPQLHETAVALRSHGRDQTTGEFMNLGHNSRMASVNAAVILHHLDHQGTYRAARAAIARKYRDHLDDLADLALPREPAAGSVENHHKFVVRVPDRDRLRRHLAEQGVATKIHYSRALPEYSMFAGRARTPHPIDASQRTARHVLSLPIHPALTDDEVNRVIDAMRTFWW